MAPHSDELEIIPRTAAPHEVLRAAVDAVAAGRSVAVATVVSRAGSAPATPGQKLAIARAADGRGPLAIGTVGGGAVERAVIMSMLTALSDPAASPKVSTYRLGPSLGMCCGGSADVLVEVLHPGLAVLLVGAGHVGVATARLLVELGFRVVLVDARESATHDDRVEGARLAGATILCAEHDDPEVLAALRSDPSGSAMVVMTHDHQLDQRVIEWALGVGFGFVGGVGSRAKAERTRKRLEARGLDPAAAGRVRMPVGVDIHARRPLEIGVAIAGELVRMRAEREGTARAARPQDEERADSQEDGKAGRTDKESSLSEPQSAPIFPSSRLPVLLSASHSASPAPITKAPRVPG